MFRRRSTLSGPKTPLEKLLALGTTWKAVGDPNETNGVDLSGGGKVDAFNDLSGNGAHFDVSTATESLKPTIGGSGQIQIDGSNSYLESVKSSDYWDFLTKPSTNSLIVALRIKDNNEGSTGVHDWIGAGDELGTSVSWHIQRIADNVFRNLMYYPPSGGTFYTSADDTIDQTGFWNFVLYLDSAIHAASATPSSLFLYEDNVQVANLSGSKKADAALSTSNSLLIGTDSDTGSSYTSDIEILKLAIGIGDLNTGKRTVINDWLNS